MPDDDLPNRIRLNAEAARVALGADVPARIARAVTPVVTRFAAERLAIPMEVEPSTFLLVQRGEMTGE
jgi:hypothetical protein